jgi:hypothetical protein
LNEDFKRIIVTASSTSISIKDTGRWFIMESASPQTITLPTPVSGIEFDISKGGSAGGVTVQVTSGSKIWASGTAEKTSGTLAGAQLGGHIKLRCYTPGVWMLVSQVGAWSF